eukprot:5597220-Pyramimonas_sp.AAC.1
MEQRARDTLGPGAPFSNPPNDEVVLEAPKGPKKRSDHPRASTATWLRGRPGATPTPPDEVERSAPESKD